MICCKKIKTALFVLLLALNMLACVDPYAETLSTGDTAAATRPMPEKGEKISLFDLLIAQTSDGDASNVKVPYPFEKLVEHLSQWGKPVQVLMPLGRSLQRHAGLPTPFADPRRLVAFASKPLSETDGKLEELDLHGRLFIGYVKQSNSLEIMSLLPGRTEFDFQLVENYCGGECKPHVENAVQAECKSCHQGGEPIFPIAQWLETNADPHIAALLKHYDADKDGKVDGIPIVQRHQDVADFCPEDTQLIEGVEVDTTVSNCFDRIVVRGKQLLAMQLLWKHADKLCTDFDKQACRKQLLIRIRGGELSPIPLTLKNDTRLENGDNLTKTINALRPAQRLGDRSILNRSALDILAKLAQENPAETEECSSVNECAAKLFIKAHKLDLHLSVTGEDVLRANPISKIKLPTVSLLNLISAFSLPTPDPLTSLLSEDSFIQTSILQGNQNLPDNIKRELFIVRIEENQNNRGSYRMALPETQQDDDSGGVEEVEGSVGGEENEEEDGNFLTADDCDTKDEIEAEAGCTIAGDVGFSFSGKQATHMALKINVSQPLAPKPNISTLTINFDDQTEVEVDMICGHQTQTFNIINDDVEQTITLQSYFCAPFDFSKGNRVIGNLPADIIQNDTYQPVLLAKEIFEGFGIKELGIKIETTAGLTWTDKDLGQARSIETNRKDSMKTTTFGFGKKGQALAFCAVCHATTSNVYPFLYAANQQALCCQLQAIREKALCYVKNKVMPPPASDLKRDFISSGLKGQLIDYLEGDNFTCECEQSKDVLLPNLCTDSNAQTQPATDD